ncbi:hypothetical protein EVAR_13692_1 [Eumeta japonica]|uniref:RNase H type-1 domain-containing protein n=1 Tax=Eumeta variegata TaxID=151549 RepID=A0A4C1UCS9_EUMVA|nr:hypothetical protein EVAR_13692_1 [Eumeta japonica]
MAGRRGDLVLDAPARSFCTAFQAEMIALQRTIRRVKNGKDKLVNIFRNSRSSLEVLTGPKTYRPLAREAKRDIFEIVVEGRTVRLFWVRAHAETASNERADELAKQAALTKKTAADYDRFPLSHVNKVISAASQGKSGNNGTPREAWVKSPNVSFPRWSKRTGSSAVADLYFL